MSPTVDTPDSMVATTATMNAEDIIVPYIWAECQPPSDQVLKMWYEVGNKLDKESTGKRPWSSEVAGNYFLSRGFGDCSRNIGELIIKE